MVAAAGSEAPVEAPRLQEPLVGVLAQVPTVTGPDVDRWFGGFKVVPEVPTTPILRDLCSSATLGGSADRLPARIGHPFEVILHDRCSTFGWRAAEYEDRVRRGLAVKRHWAVDREWERGELIPGNFHLSATYTAPNGPATAQLAAGANVSPSDALALLDEAIANSALGRGMIFATAFVGAKWKAANVLSDMETVDGRTQILSPSGNYVIIGTGFEGRGPDDTVPAAHASQWAYATDPIAVLASTPETTPGSLAEATDKATNTVVFRQKQWFAVVWPAMLHAAVKVSTATPTIA